MTAIVAKIILTIFGLLPSLWLSYFAVLGVIQSSRFVLSGKLTVGILLLAVCLGCLLGTLSLISYLLGKRIEALRVGMLIGAISMAAIVIAPFAKMFLASIGVITLRFNSGLDNYGLLLGYAILGIAPLVVYFVLAYRGIRGHRS